MSIHGVFYDRTFFEKIRSSAGERRSSAGRRRPASRRRRRELHRVFKRNVPHYRVMQPAIRPSQAPALYVSSLLIGIHSGGSSLSSNHITRICWIFAF